MLQLAYSSFGRQPPEGLQGVAWLGVWLLCAGFVLVSIGITVFLNFFSLFAGILITFLGQDRVRFRFLTFFGKLPVIAVALPVLFGYAVWHQSGDHGAIGVVWPAGAVLAVAALCLVLAAAFKRFRVT